MQEEQEPAGEPGAGGGEPGAGGGEPGAGGGKEVRYQPLIKWQMMNL